MQLNKLIIGVALLAAGLVFAGGCSSQKPTIPENTMPPKPAAIDTQNKQALGPSKKILIAYFSYEGNTKTFAESIQKQVGGELFAIETQNVYPKNRDKVIEQAKGEVSSKYIPKLTNKVADIRSYDIIFVGTPIWWYTIAPPVRTFLAENDLADKTIIPFSTHKGSGLSGIDRVMQELQPKAKISAGLAIWDGQVKESRRKLQTGCGT